jgi:hypothetical protein
LFKKPEWGNLKSEAAIQISPNDFPEIIILRLEMTKGLPLAERPHIQPFKMVKNPLIVDFSPKIEAFTSYVE